MKRRFTILTAALALLVMMTLPEKVVGQYSLATSIAVGDEVVLVNASVGHELSGVTTSGTTYGTVVEVTNSMPSGSYSLTVVAGSSTGSFAFKTPDNTYLSWTSGNSLTTSNSVTNASSWTVSISNSIAVITNVGTTERKLQYNPGSSTTAARFACYKNTMANGKLYKRDSSLLDNDLSINPTSLSLDMSANPNTGTISYTTSSTGAVTVSQSEYVTTSVSGNTITVTPVKVTPSAQTITINQAADDNYAAGSVTFTVSVTNSTPTTTVTIDASGITNTDVYVNPEAGLLSATVTSGDSPVSGATVTWSGDNDDVATIASDGTVTLVGAGTVNFTASYAGVSGQYQPSSATYEMTVTSSAPYVQPTTIEITPNYTFWGKTEQFSGSTYNTLDGSQDNVSLHWTRGNGSTYANSSAMRFYKDNDLTFTAPEGYEIISIALTVSGTYSDLLFSPTGYDNETTTWTGAAETVTMSRPSNATSYATISKFTITLAPIGSAVTTTTTINVPADFNKDIYQGTNAGILTATVTSEGGSALDNPAITWSSSNTGVATIDANGAVTLVAAGTTTITASYAGVEDEYRPSTGTYELTVTDSNAPGTENNPYTVAQALAASPSNGVYVHGIISTITEVSTDYGNATYRISDDGTTSGEMIVYRGKYLENAAFTSSDQIQVGDIVTVTGNLSVYNGTNQLAKDNYLVSLERPTYPIIIANDINLTYDATSGSIEYTISNPTSATLTATSSADWISNINVGSESVTFTTTANEGDTDRSATITLSYTGATDKVITVTQGHYVVDYATLPFVWEGGSKADFLALNGVTAQGLGSDYASGNAPYLIKFDDTNDYIQVKTDSQPGKVTIDVKMIGGASTSTITIQGSADGETFTNIETLTISGAQNDVLTLETSNAFAANVRYVRMLFTKGSNVGVGPITITKVYTKTINGYGTNQNGGYELIASPIGTISNSDLEENVINIFSNSYDLYYFDQSNKNEEGNYLEWVNYRKANGEANTNFNLVRGKGYLYANSQTVDLVFTGFAPSTDDFDVTLAYDENARFKGWNLVGNPYAVPAYFTTDRDFYTMNSAGTSFEVCTDPEGSIQPMQGVFVIAKNEETLTFTTTQPTEQNRGIVLKLSEGRSNTDAAIVRFGEGHTLPKLQLFEGSTKIYIPQDGQDFAVVRSEEMGEMPVNFKAESNGTYSLNVSGQNTEFAYLHLIDNMTGNDVDLLQTPSYSFEAKTTDYESRFKLVFATGDNSNDDNFAFYSNGSFVINNEGNAELQVIDIMGRIVKSESINGCANVSVNGAAGVYMLRLVNGDNVKVQKVVVK